MLFSATHHHRSAQQTSCSDREAETKRGGLAHRHADSVARKRGDSEQYWEAGCNEKSGHLPKRASLVHESAVPQLQDLEKLAQPVFLVADQMPRLGEHSLNHGLGVVPFARNASAHEIFASTCAVTMGRDDIGDYESSLIENLHVAPRR
jgi:hypothetical protein